MIHIVWKWWGVEVGPIACISLGAWCSKKPFHIVHEVCLKILWRHLMTSTAWCDFRGQLPPTILYGIFLKMYEVGKNCHGVCKGIWDKWRLIFILEFCEIQVGKCFGPAFAPLFVGIYSQKYTRLRDYHMMQHMILEWEWNGDVIIWLTKTWLMLTPFYADTRWVASTVVASLSIWCPFHQ